MSNATRAVPRRSRGLGRLTRVLAATLLPVAALPVLPGAVAAAQPGDAYSLAATVSPAPLTAAECAADPRCVPAPVPAGAGADDQPALSGAVAAAAALASPAVVAADGTVSTPPAPATVYLAPGTYLLARPLQLPPNVDLRGAGITATTLLLAPDSWRNFGYSFMVRASGAVSAGSTNTVADLTVNGSCRKGAGAPDPVVPPTTCDLGAGANYGGGIGAGDRWTVRQVRFTNLNYFKLWIAGTTDVRAVDNRFDGWGGAGSGDQDNIGGGGGAVGVVLEHNQFDETIRGNSIDFTNATGVTIRANTVHATRAYLASRGVSDYGSVYLEGVTGSTVETNVLYGAHLVLQSNSRYDHTGRNEHVTNPRTTVVTGNRFVDPFHTGITVTYDDYTDTDGIPHTLRPGGGNTITANTVLRPTLSGILVVGCLDAAKDTADTIVGNTIVDAGFGGSTNFSTGCGTFDTAGIGLSIGRADVVYANTVTDDQPTPTTWYGIHLGARNGKTAPTQTVLADPSGQAPDNTATGVVGGLYRRAAAAPEPVTLLSGARTANGPVLTWKEAYPTSTNPVGGYRVYRNGVPVATLPVGSPTIPGNLLTEGQASLETGVTGWVPAPRTSVGWNQAGGAVGGASLTLTATGAGQIGGYGPAVPVVAGGTYTAVASFRAVGAGRRVRAGAVWLDAGGAVITRVLSGNTATVDSTGTWMTSSFGAQAPANAVSAQVFAAVEGAVVGESHLVDRIGLVAGSATETWTDRSAPAGTATYQVVSYRAGDGENSAVTSVVVR